MAFNMLSNSRRHASVTMADIDAMGGLEFESFVGELLKDLGYTGVQVTKSTGDQGVDVVASKNGTKYAIQCKNYSSPLNNKPIQEVTTGKAVYGCDVGVVLTNSTFNQSAQEAAKATNTLLWDRNTLQNMLLQSKYSRPVQTSPTQNRNIPKNPEQPTPPNANAAIDMDGKSRSTFKFVLGVFLVGFNGLALFAGVVTLATSGFGAGDAALFLFLLALFLLGLRLVVRNKKPTEFTGKTRNSYKEYSPFYGKRVGWGAVALCLFFCFPAGYFLLYKKMSQYADKEEMLRNSKTLNIWATILMILGLIYPLMSILGQMEFSMALLMFACLFPYGLFLFKKAKGLQALYASLPEVASFSAKDEVHTEEPQELQEVEEDEPLLGPSTEKESFSEFHYHANAAERTYIVVHCKGCNAPNRIAKGSTCECEYCGRPVSEDSVPDEVTLDADEAAISHAFAVIQRLLESLDEVSDDLNDSFDRLTLAMDTYPNRSMPLDVEMNRVGSSLNAFSAKSKRISAGIKAQVMIACDNLMGYDDESWDRVEEQLEKLNEIKSTMSETISGLRTFKHSIDGLNLNAGLRIRSAQMKLAKEIETALSVMQSSMADFSETLRIFRNAKFTSKTERIKHQRGGMN